MTNTNFLPQGYEVPASNGGGYMKFKEGLNKFRTLSRPVIGWVGWMDDKTPKRVHQEAEFNGTPLRERPKHFWAFVVWNYQTEAVEILEISQATIQRALEALINNPQWGAPYNYDITITRAGASLDTTYNLQPSPPAPLADEIQAALLNTSVNLEALFTNDDPFTTDQAPTPPAPAQGPPAAAYAAQSQPGTQAPQTAPSPQNNPLFDNDGNFTANEPPY